MNSDLIFRQKLMQRVFSRMNDQQREAVFCVEGPLLILAGAGSGKTTVLINRIANLVQFGKAYHSPEMPILTDAQREELIACAAGTQTPSEELLSLLAVDPCPAWRILAITFTNKAAGELKARLVSRLGPEGNDVTAGTFHSFCARILRREGENLGYSSHFTIYDTDDSRRLMKEILKARGIDEKTLPVKTVLGEISRAKDSLLSPEAYAATVSVDPRLRKVSDCYAIYQARLKEADAMDFDDLLCKTVELFTTHPEVLQRYQNRYDYLMVDEYQDTNHAQYRLVSLLAARSGNLCVVGDDDQSIYQFRGATIENILNFEDEFAGCRTIRLEQNYRSTGRILTAANHVIAQNKGRKGKTLWTANPEGEKLDIVTFDNGDEEAKWIAGRILDKVATGAHLRDFAVLYRANAQSNSIETALVRSGIPYRIFGGHRFYDTQEVRDAMAYLRVLCNPTDTVALRRIINQPRRGIGDTTVERAAGLAEQQDIPLYEVLSHADEYADLSRAAGKLKEFIRMLDTLREKLDEGTLPHDVYTEMLEVTGYRKMWELQGEAEAERVENLRELESSIRKYEQECDEGAASLAGFLEEASLMTDVDNYDSDADTVVLMTMHAAKGLEFPTVFLPGMEDGIFPSLQTMFEPDKMEEERRLCYVAITRARERLIITNAASRMMYGQTNRNRPSRFLGDIPPEVRTETKKTTARPFMNEAFGGGRRDFGGYGNGYGGRSSGVRTSYDDSVMPDYESYSQEPPRAAARASWASAPTTPPKPTAPAAPCVWQVGDRVKHNAFGSGTVKAASPMGNDVLLTIAFDKIGEKKLMAKFARLEKE